MSAIAGLDTATADAAVAVVRDGELLAESRVGPPHSGRPRHAETLLAELEQVVAASGGWDAVGTIAVGIGPGSYTGLRIGIATARALGQALEKPLAPVSTLAALADGIAARGGVGRRPLLPVIDARRAQVFASLVSPHGALIWEPLVATPEELSGRLRAALESGLAEGEAPLAAGDGALRFRRELEAAGVSVLPDADPAHRLSARSTCLLGASVAPARPEEVRPVYLRPPDAERWLERDRRRAGI
jgi:tRNA threonylcarbamoyladenosine biosynthesis protein TsaB